MHGHMKGITIGMLAGIAAGTAAGIVMSQRGHMPITKSSMMRSANKAKKAVGDIIEDVGDYLK